LVELRARVVHGHLGLQRDDLRSHSLLPREAFAIFEDDFSHEALVEVLAEESDLEERRRDLAVRQDQLFVQGARLGQRLLEREDAEEPLLFFVDDSHLVFELGLFVHRHVRHREDAADLLEVFVRVLRHLLDWVRRRLLLGTTTAEQKPRSSRPLDLPWSAGQTSLLRIIILQTADISN